MSDVPKPSGYYDHPRPEIAMLITPTDGISVLDIGCGGGGLGSLLRPKGASRLVGIELNPVAAERARTIYDEVLVGNIEQLNFPWEPQSFDCIVCADVLEHLIDPWSLLTRLHSLIKPTGYIVASIPNIRNRGVIAEILMGYFRYRDAGILDNTHIRFFTFNSAVHMFHQSGYTITSIGPVYPSDGQEILTSWQKSGMDAKMTEAIRLLSGVDQPITEDDLMDLLTLQFILRAEPRQVLQKAS